MICLNFANFLCEGNFVSSVRCFPLIFLFDLVSKMCMHKYPGMFSMEVKTTDFHVFTGVLMRASAFVYCTCRAIEMKVAWILSACSSQFFLSFLKQEPCRNRLFSKADLELHDFTSCSFVLEHDFCLA